MSTARSTSPRPSPISSSARTAPWSISRSINSFTAPAGSGVYPVSKGAIAQFTRALAAELAPDGVRVNAIAPGIIATAMAEPTIADPKRLEAFPTHVPMKRVGQPEELVGPVVFLCSDCGELRDRRASWRSMEVFLPSEKGIGARVDNRSRWRQSTTSSCCIASAVDLSTYEDEPDAVTSTPQTLARDGFGEDPQFAALIAERGGKPVGFALYTFNYSVWTASARHLHRGHLGGARGAARRRGAGADAGAGPGMRRQGLQAHRPQRARLEPGARLPTSASASSGSATGCSYRIERREVLARLGVPTLRPPLAQRAAS